MIAMDYTTEKFEVDYWQGVLVFTNKETTETRVLKLYKNNRLATLNEFKSGIKSHGLERACEVFFKIAATQ